MASGVIPAHASYFLAYEHLKKYFNVDNEELNFTSTLAIGSCTTFFHDFFITPADGKYPNHPSLFFLAAFAKPDGKARNKDLQ